MNDVVFAASCPPPPVTLIGVVGVAQLSGIELEAVLSRPTRQMQRTSTKQPIQKLFEHIPRDELDC